MFYAMLTLATQDMEGIFHSYNVVLKSSQVKGVVLGSINVSLVATSVPYCRYVELVVYLLPLGYV